MEDTEITPKENKEIYFSLLGEASGKDVKVKLGLAELIIQAMILLLLV